MNSVHSLLLIYPYGIVFSACLHVSFVNRCFYFGAFFYPPFRCDANRRPAQFEFVMNERPVSVHCSTSRLGLPNDQIDTYNEYK